MAAVTLPIVTTYNDKGVKGAQGSLKDLIGSQLGAAVSAGALVRLSAQTGSGAALMIGCGAQTFGKGAKDSSARRVSLRRYCKPESGSETLNG